MGKTIFEFDQEREAELIRIVQDQVERYFGRSPSHLLISEGTAEAEAEAAKGGPPVEPPALLSEGPAALARIIAGTTDKARAFLGLLADHAPDALTAANIADRLGLSKAVSIAGLTSGLTRKQAQLQRTGQITAQVQLFREHWDGVKMSYSVSEEQADAILTELAKIPLAASDPTEGRAHAVYSAVIAAVESGRLSERFTRGDFRRECPGFAEATYRLFLYKHSLGNRSGNTELFRRTGPGEFELIRPFRYGLGANTQQQA